jgi:atypical dual specificity phosphatase
MRIFATTSPIEVGSGVVPDVSELLPNFWIGRALHNSDETARLKTELGVTAVVSLETDRDLEAAGLTWTKIDERYRALGLDLHRVEIEGDWPAAVIEVMRRAMILVRRLIQNGHTVFLHCSAGVNRSPTVALMYLNMIEGMSVEEALATVQLSRPQAKPYEDVVVVLRALAARRGRPNVDSR